MLQEFLIAMSIGFDYFLAIYPPFFPFFYALNPFDLECVWYCGSYCGCGLKKVVLKKVLLVVVGLKK